MSFKPLFDKESWHKHEDEIYSKTELDVEIAVARDKINLDDFKALLSPAALAYLEPIASKSHALTTQRFGQTIQMYAPMYLSNECQNICTYCGFSLDNPMQRKTLNDDEIVQEGKAIKSLGFDHILLVTGEANRSVGVDYLEKAIQLLRPYFSNISIEVQPLEQLEYQRLRQSGLNTVLVYQETYHQKEYKKHHPKGKKSNFYYRLDTPDRLGKAGVHKIGLGVLIGLEDWRVDSFFNALHLRYLEQKYWKTKYTVSFPRLRPYSGGVCPEHIISDAELIQLICAYRLLNKELELSLSTRESQQFRNNAIKLGITTTSAGSKTNPGGYCVDPKTLEQFEISDDRSPTQFAKEIRSHGYEVVWKNWAPAYDMI